jgi:hypothetical protein
LVSPGKTTYRIFRDIGSGDIKTVRAHVVIKRIQGVANASIPHARRGRSICIGLSRADHQALDNGINDLDGVLQTAAGQDGDTFADVRAQFSGHELCDGAGWLNSITLPIDDSYHPTATGQKEGYLPVFSAAAANVGQ